MPNNAEKDLIRIELTKEQTDQLKSVTPKDAEAIELTLHELEERIAPRLAGNHNETLLLA
jgi:hypothetical protein